MRARKEPLHELDEEHLVKLVARGDRSAFEELYRRTSPWPATCPRRRCADDQIVAEVLQETYLAVRRAADAFAGWAVGGSAVRWLWTIAARRLVDAFRHRAHHAQPPPAADRIRWCPPPAEEQALASSAYGQVGQAPAALAPELRDVLQAMGSTGCRSGRPPSCSRCPKAP